MEVYGPTFLTACPLLRGGSHLFFSQSSRTKRRRFEFSFEALFTGQVLDPPLSSDGEKSLLHNRPCVLFSIHNVNHLRGNSKLAPFSSRFDLGFT